MDMMWNFGDVIVSSDTPKCSKKNLLQFNFVHHNSHTVLYSDLTAKKSVVLCLEGVTFCLQEYNKGLHNLHSMLNVTIPPSIRGTR
jgi:hypothetical protein